jgi:chemotaxis methyl-accepting protein methylase
MLGLKDNINEIKHLQLLLNITYSEFFRNPLSFSILENIVLPSLIKKIRVSSRKEIRIWSAACAGGQEVYSLAILLNELQYLNSTGFKYRIFASDSNEALLNEAAKGVFPILAMKNVTLKRWNQWFVKTGDKVTIRPELQHNVEFSTFDLLADNVCFPPESIFGDFDLALCSNILFYYNPEAQSIIINKLSRSLASGGFLVTGEAERSILRSHRFKEIFPHSTIFRPVKVFRTH